MQLPSVEDVNVTRLTRFDDAITEALTQTDRIDEFRGIIAHYVEHHNVPEADVAAALAVVAQGETPLLLSADDARFQRFEREERGDRRDRADRGAAGERPERRPRSTKPMTPYRIEVGKRHRVEPRQIVGALANEGGLSRDDFGHIQIRPDFSIVELPTDMPSSVLNKLKDTRISGQLIEIKPDRRGGAGRFDRAGRGDREGRGERRDRAPR